MMSEAVIIGAVAGVLLALVVLIVRSARGRAPSRAAEPSARRGPRVVMLDVVAHDRDPAPARRLATAAAAPLFDENPELEQVEVRDREGALLAIIDRAEGLELADRDPFADVTTADRLSLPVSVRDRLPEDPRLVEVVVAILEEAGYGPVVEQDVVRVGDRAVVAVEATDAETLNAAFLRYRASGARSGVVVSRRSVAVSEIQRRELLAPDLCYAPPGSLQRMADAVAVGGDPITFAVGPPHAAE